MALHGFLVTSHLSPNLRLKRHLHSDSNINCHFLKDLESHACSLIINDWRAGFLNSSFLSLSSSVIELWEVHCKPDSRRVITKKLLGGWELFLYSPSYWHFPFNFKTIRMPIRMRNKKSITWLSFTINSWCRFQIHGQWRFVKGEFRS